jgi:pilus assembly protein FimV
MRTAVLCGIAIACSSAAFAQTPDAQPPSTAAPRTITLTGCVGGGTNAQPITLANAMVVPTGQDAATTPLPVPGAASAGTTQPTAGGVGTPGTATAGVGTAGTASADVGSAAGTGVAGTAGAPGTPGAVGTSGVAPAAGAGSSATIAGTAPAGSSGSSISGYRLSGADMASWIGRRVQIVGSLVPALPGAMPAAGATGAPHATFPEFRVVSVQPMTGDCPQK